MIGGFRGKCRVIQIDMHIGEHGAFGCNTVDPVQRFGKVRMGRVRFTAQGIDDPKVEVFKVRPDVIGDVGHVWQVGRVIDAKAQSIDGAVLFNRLLHFAEKLQVIKWHQ